MAIPSSSKELSLKWLELFQTYARTQSLHGTSQETGLSISTVSHHLRSLEDHLGVALFDHARRPMVLTPTGRTFLRDISQAMQSIRKATAEASAGNIAEASNLRIGTIADLDSDVTPEIAVYLSQKMPDCSFLYHTGTSRDIIRMLRHRELDLGVVTSPLKLLNDLIDWPLLRDPFVAVLPAAAESSLPDIVAGKTNLPFLQFSSDLIIAGQIEAQLRRLGVQLPNKFECANNQTLMAMVAAGAGWTITTPLLFARARRFQPKLQMLPFPGKNFARTLSLVTSPDCARAVVDLVSRQVRHELNQQVIAPTHRTSPWLKDQFTLID
ncbi:LysR family transcriptional regulator [uncultured Sulfitobacter sp.]|uniref:LysR family transcriptional regulator n=1 Tax=uncultured Sulfitobacter sp. TaxID=191468 RepID=UPI002636CC2E|nr:LysR family transcriptional regulator [uncultured Sulfitobacter sp.]